jgi:hypothetical protein
LEAKAEQVAVRKARERIVECAVRQLRFHHFPLGYVVDGAQAANGSADGVQDGLPTLLDEPLRAVGREDAVFEGERHSAEDGLRDGFLGDATVDGVDGMEKHLERRAERLRRESENAKGLV